jgi:monoamine oxidase
MNRNDFNKTIFLYTLGLTLTPSLIGCSLNSKGVKKNSVLILGAGAAGLYAGYLLNKLNVDFKILEASSIHGGRVGKIVGFADYDIDMGAQWLHGKQNIIGDYVLQHNIPITLDDTPYSYYFQNEIMANLPRDPFIFEERDLPDVTFKAFAEQKGFNQSYSRIFDAIAGINGADKEEISSFWNYFETSKSKSGEGDYKFENTYFDVLDMFLARPISNKILYNTEVKLIDYSNDEVSVKTKDDTEFIADKILVTVPISILKAKTIHFIPDLPEEKTIAFSKIGMGPGLKVFMKFKEQFYPDNIYGGNICAAFYNDSTGKKTKDNILIAFVMGNQAKTLCELNDDEIIKLLLADLDNMFSGLASVNYLNHVVINFKKKPFIRGAYSFSTQGMGNAREIAAESISKKLFFAGEAMNLNGNHQTVHGALESSKIAIEEMFL